MPALLTAISDKSCFQLVKLSVWKHLLLDEDEGSKDIFPLFVDNVMIMYIVSYFIIEHVFNFVHDCCCSLTLIDLKGCFDTDARCSFESHDVDWLMESEISCRLSVQAYRQILQAFLRQ